MAEEKRGKRPKRIILVRHGESQGNVDSNTCCCIADSKIRLTDVGIIQAKYCGQKIRDLIENDGNPDWRVYFYVSPHQRTLRTLKEIGRAFSKQHILGVREEPRIREQDFGNFQQQEQMKLVKGIRSRFGRFFYRFPEGESAADVFDRVTSGCCILVSHLVNISAEMSHALPFCKSRICYSDFADEEESLQKVGSIAYLFTILGKSLFSGVCILR